jgi:hypothetical protein
MPTADEDEDDEEEEEFARVRVQRLRQLRTRRCEFRSPSALLLRSFAPAL